MFNFWKNNKIWFSICLLLEIILILVFTFLNEIQAIKLAVNIGLIFLFLTLFFPSFNLLFKQKPKWLTQILTNLIKYKRDFGITSGVLFATHGIFASVYFGKSNFNFLLRDYIIPGFLAVLIFYTLLFTSNKFSQKKLGKNWKKTHSLVWFSLPFIWIHSFLATYNYNDNVSILTILTLSILFFLSILQLFKKQYKHFLLILSGIIIISLIYNFFYPNTLKQYQKEINNYNSYKNSNSSNINSSITNFSLTIRDDLNRSNSSVESSLNSSTLSDITLNELKKYNSSNDCWVSYQKKVYDVTSYINQHPGGKREILKVCVMEIDDYSKSHPGGEYSSFEIKEILKTRQVAILIN